MSDRKKKPDDVPFEDVYAGPPVPGAQMMLVYAGPPAPDAAMAPVYAGPPAPESEMMMAYAGPPAPDPVMAPAPNSEMMMVYAAPAAGVYAGPFMMNNQMSGFPGMMAAFRGDYPASHAEETPEDRAPFGFCPVCGELIRSERAAFCSNCGTALPKKDKPEEGSGTSADTEIRLLYGGPGFPRKKQ